MARRFCTEPDLARTTAEVLQRLRSRNYYEQGLVDAVFQNWVRRPVTFVDAYAFMLIYCKIVTGEFRIARIPVGETPGADADTADNNAKLQQLAPQFSAEFWGGCTDHDGWFTWHDHLHVGGYINVDHKLVVGPEIAIAPRRLQLEVGTQSAAKTLYMLNAGRGIARWPYDSDDLWVICDPTAFSRVETVCQRDDDGWPCSRSIEKQ